MPFPLCPPPSRVENKSHNNESRLELECEEKSTETVTESEKERESEGGINLILQYPLYTCAQRRDQFSQVTNILLFIL